MANRYTEMRSALPASYVNFVESRNGCFRQRLLHSLPVLARLGRKGYGIYLCHVLAVETCHAIEVRCHLARSAGLDVATFVLSFAGSLAIVVALGKSKRLAWLIG